MIHVIAAELAHQIPVIAHGVAAHDDAGHVEGARRHMTGETTGPASRERRSGRLIERVEHHALLGIVGRELDHGSARDVGDDDRLVEEDGAGVVRAGVRTLHARFREHEQLRFHRNAERFQDGDQIAGSGIALQRSSALSERLIQLRDTVGRRSNGVLNAWMLVQYPGPSLLFWPEVNALWARAMPSAPVPTSSRPRPLRRGMLLSNDVPERFLVVLVADVLDQFRIRKQSLALSIGQRLRVRLRIVDRDLDIQVPDIAAPEPFDQVHCVAMRMAAAIEPGLVVEAGGVNDQGVAFPETDRVSQPGRLRIFGKLAAIHEYLPKERHRLVQNHDEARRLDDLVGCVYASSRGTPARH